MPKIGNSSGEYGFKVVITACMRKLLVILNTIVRNQTVWNAKTLSI